MQRIFISSILIVFLTSHMQASEDPRVTQSATSRLNASQSAHQGLEKDLQQAAESTEALRNFLYPQDGSSNDSRLKLDIRTHGEDSALETVAARTDDNEKKLLLSTKLEELKGQQ